MRTKTKNEERVKRTCNVCGNVWTIPALKKPGAAQLLLGGVAGLANGAFHMLLARCARCGTPGDFKEEVI